MCSIQPGCPGTINLSIANLSCQKTYLRETWKVMGCLFPLGDTLVEKRECYFIWINLFFFSLLTVNTLSSAVFCFSRGGICFHTLLVAFSRRTIFIFQILRSWILGDSSDQPVLQLGVLCPLLPERSHQPHPLQHHVQEVPRRRMPALRTQSPAKEKTLQHQAGQLTCMDRTHRRHMTRGPVPEHHTPVLPESHHGGDVGQGTNRQGKLYLCRHLDLLGDVT